MKNLINENNNSKFGRRLPAMLAIAMLIGLSLFVRADAAAGDLDAAFGTGGKVTTDFFTQSDLASAIAVQSDGKIVVAGFADDAGIGIGTFFALTRYNSDGTLDAAFGIGGRSNINFANTSAKIGLAIQNDGKIVVVGTVEQNVVDQDFGILRFNPDGFLDLTFGIGGKVTTDFFGLFDGATAVAVQSDGKIVVSGLSQSPILSVDFAVARYLDNGDLDPAFGINGKTTTDFSGQYDRANDLAIQTDGKIVVAGTAQSGNIGVARYDANGNLDAAFGNGGTISSDFSGGIDEGTSVAVQEDGKIVVAGRANSAGATSDFGLIRYDANGSLDAAFGTGGKVTTDFLGLGEIVNDVAIQSNGKIVAVGLVTVFADQSTGDIDFALARYDTNGSLDQTFGVGGKVTTAFMESESAQAVAIQADCKIVAAGFSSPSNSSDTDFAVARYDGGSCVDEPPPPCPKPQGFWKNNPSLWTVDSLALGSQSYSKTELLALLNNSTKSDASINLARQLIAAKLNIENGSDPIQIESVITNSDNLLSGFNNKLPYKVKSSSSIGQMILTNSNMLDVYNNGFLTPVCNP